MFGDLAEERQNWTLEERKPVLMRTGKRCACCGAKLTLEHFTIDHVIPLSRGGKNEYENMVPLCFVCNKQKGSLIYYPGDYYTYMSIHCPKELEKLHLYVEEWLKDYVKGLDLYKYPLISPVTTCVYTAGNLGVKQYMSQFLYDIIYMTADMKRHYSRIIYDKGYTYYAVMKRTTQELFAILRIELCDNYGELDYRQLTIYVAWTKSSPKNIINFATHLAACVTSRLRSLDYGPDIVTVATDFVEYVGSHFSTLKASYELASGVFLSVSLGESQLNGREDKALASCIVYCTTNRASRLFDSMYDEQVKKRDT